jgi:Uma2 family endonuclease
MSPEEFFLHGTLETEVVAVWSTLVRSQGWGYVVSDRTRITCPNVELSVEPDVVYISKTSLSEGRVRLIPPSGGGSDRYVEVEGPRDLIVEVVSDSSVSKDTQRLPAAYFQAGVREYWLADARGTELVFTIHHRGEAAFVAVSPDRDGYQASSILKRLFRLIRQRDDQDHWVYDLETK